MPLSKKYLISVITGTLLGTSYFPLQALANSIPESPQNEEMPTSTGCSCAADLKDDKGYNFKLPNTEIQGIETFEQIQGNSQDSSLFPSLDLLSDAQMQDPANPDTQTQDTTPPQETKDNSDRWRFQFQPYVTIPLNTYGEATARGRTINYSLSLAEVLQSLRVTASGRVEAWKGRLGFIVDGYFVSLGGIGNLQKQIIRNPSALDALNYLTSKGVNLRMSDLVNGLEQKVINVQEQVDNTKQQLTNAQERVDNAKQQLVNAQERVDNAKQQLANAQEQVDNIKQQLTNAQGQVDNIKQKLANAQEQVNNIKQQVANAQERFDNAQQQLAQAQERVDNAQQLGQFIKDQFLQKLEPQVQTLKIITAENTKKMQIIDAKVQELKNNLASQGQELSIPNFKLDDLQNLKLSAENFQQVLALNIKDLPQTQDLQQLNTKLQELGQLPSLGQLQETVEKVQQELINTKQIIQEGIAKIQDQKALISSEALEKLETQLQEAKALVDQELERIDQIKQFSENRLPQQLDINAQTNLQFEQGIYDFAISYHLGELPNPELPEKPSNRNYPLIWFEPIAGVRLNNIDINIDQTTDVALSSSLVNFKGTFQNTYNQGRTWFEPMLGGKLGVQLSDPITLWLRGDVSGFGLAGETDLSWNVLFGMDWWVRRSVSLQLAYRFYEINYQIGTGDNAFGFKESFNGPYLSATFHF